MSWDVRSHSHCIGYCSLYKFCVQFVFGLQCKNTYWQKITRFYPKIRVELTSPFVNPKFLEFEMLSPLCTVCGQNCKAIPVRAYYSPKVVRLSAFTPQEIFLVLISLRGWFDPMDIVQPNSVNEKSSDTNGNRTFRLVAQCRKQLRHLVSCILHKIIVPCIPWEYIRSTNGEWRANSALCRDALICKECVSASVVHDWNISVKNWWNDTDVRDCWEDSD